MVIVRYQFGKKNFKHNEVNPKEVRVHFGILAQCLLEVYVGSHAGSHAERGRYS